MTPAGKTAALVVTVGVIAVAGVGVYASQHHASASSQSSSTGAPVVSRASAALASPAASSAAVEGVQAAVAPVAVAAETVYSWPGLIAADSATGNLRSDLGWRNGASSGVRGTALCGVATMTAPRFKRVLRAPNDTVIGNRAPAWYFTVCTRAFHQWDSAEASSNGAWPKASQTSAIESDAAWRDGLSVLQARALIDNHH